MQIAGGNQMAMMEEKSKVYDLIYIESALKVHHIQHFAELEKLEEDPEMINFRNVLKAG